MKTLFIILAFIGCTVSTHAQVYSLSELLEFAKWTPADLSSYFMMEAWVKVSDDTMRVADDKTMLEHNIKWVYTDKGDTMPKFKFFYKKKQNKTTYQRGYFENIQYTLACKECFREIRDSVIATGWAKTQDERNDEQIMQTYDAGDCSVMLFTHFKKQVEYYDIIVFRKKPVE